MLQVLIPEDSRNLLQKNIDFRANHTHRLFPHWILQFVHISICRPPVPIRVLPRSVDGVVEVELDRRDQNAREKVPQIIVWAVNEVKLLVVQKEAHGARFRRKILFFEMSFEKSFKKSIDQHLQNILLKL